MTATARPPSIEQRHVQDRVGQRTPAQRPESRRRTAASQRRPQHRLGTSTATPAPDRTAAATVSSAPARANAALSIFPCARLASADGPVPAWLARNRPSPAEPSTSGLGAAEPITAATMHDFAAVTGSNRMATKSSSASNSASRSCPLVGQQAQAVQRRPPRAVPTRQLAQGHSARPAGRQGLAAAGAAAGPARKRPARIHRHPFHRRDAFVERGHGSTGGWGRLRADGRA